MGDTNRPLPEMPQGEQIGHPGIRDNDDRKENGKVCKEAHVFEGVFDSLSWVTLYGDPNKDVIVLNSIENVKALSRLSSTGAEALHGVQTRQSQQNKRE